MDDIQTCDLLEFRSSPMLVRAETVGRLNYAASGVVVFILTYNNAKYVGQAISSVLNQQLAIPLNVWICDDASTDETPSIIRDYVARYPQQVCAILESQNLYSLGVRQRQELYKLVGSKYVANLDGDDYWLSDHKLEAQRQALERDPRAVFATHSWNQVDADGHLLSTVRRPGRFRKKLSLMSFAISNPVNPSTTLIKRSVTELLDFPAGEKTVCQDYELFSNLSTCGGIATVDEVLSAYRVYQSEFSRFVGKDPQCRPRVHPSQLIYLSSYRRMLWRLGNRVGGMLVGMRWKRTWWARILVASSKAALEVLDANLTPTTARPRAPHRGELASSEKTI